MAAARIVPVILCGGTGSRLWPASRESLPKPFLPMIDGTTTFSGTLDRVADRDLFASPVIIANSDHRFLVAEEVRARGMQASIVLEPQPRDSAAAIAVAAAFVEARHPGAIMLVLAADHLIREVDGFRASIVTALPVAESGRIATFGVEPINPATRYGYIRLGAPLGREDVCEVAAFVEKPDAATASRYLAEGYLWNSGNFLMKASVGLSEIGRCAPAVASAACGAVAGIVADGDFLRLDAAAFAEAPKLSFDHAVMEKTDRAAVVRASFDWTDLGTWAAIWDESGRDASGNVAVGNVVITSSCNNYVQSDGLLVGLVGVDDLVVVVSEDAVLVTDRRRADDVKQLVALLRESHPAEVSDHVRLRRR